ncbi:MAG: deoxycytidylate deaminase [bacterium]
MSYQRPSWDEYFMVIAKVVSTRSTCNSRRTGAVVVRDKQILTTGYNGAMPGCEHCIDKVMPNGEAYCERRARNIADLDKYNFCVASHAESNAISQAADKGISLRGGTIYTTLFPCLNCLKMIAIAGIKKIVYEYEYASQYQERDNFWQEQVAKTGIISTKLTIKSETIDIIIESLKIPTSGRILSATL